MIMEETKTILQTSHRLRYTLIIEGFLVGGCAGIISIVYRQLLAYAEEWVQWLSAMMRQSVMWAAAGFVLLALIALGISLLLRHEPLISGSGIPQIEAEVSGHLDERWFRVLWARWLTGVLVAAGRTFLGREGPSIQLGGMCGKRVRQDLPQGEHRTALSDHLRRGCRAFGRVQRAFGRRHVRAGGGCTAAFRCRSSFRS